MHSSASMCQTAANTALNDLLEVERLMADVIEWGDEADVLSMNVAKIAALYHLNGGGQRIRSRLAPDSAHCLGLTPRDGIALAATAELLHNASLIHGDLQARDQVRRGCPPVWVAYGEETAICAGGYRGALHTTRTTADSFAAGYQIYDDLCDFEMDLVRDTTAPILNIVLVLQKNNASSVHDAWEAAQKLGLMHLKAAATSSTVLPKQSGRLFREMANDLHARLKRKCMQ